MSIGNNEPYAILVFGAPMSGKTTFAKNFSDLIKAPFINFTELQAKHRIRERYSYASGDRHRGQNQQQVITKLIEKITDPHYLIRYPSIIAASEDSFETNLTYDEITDFARYQLAELKNWQVESISLDGSGAMLPTYSMGSQKLYVMLPYQSTIDNAKSKIDDYLK